MFKQSIQAEYNKSALNGALDLVDHIQALEALQYQKVKVIGEYSTKYQILIDNRIENDHAGFHVITPFKIQNSNRYVLVNRGWVQGNDKHTDIPAFSTPLGMQEIEGMVWVPSKKIFTLENKTQSSPSSQNWQLVWQNLDMDKYEKSAQIDVLPVIIKLDPQSKAGGFVRNWQVPADRIMTNLGYAYQWFGFAFAALAIYIYMSSKRINKQI